VLPRHGRDGENRIVFVNEDRAGEPERPDAFGDLPDLLPRVRSSVALGRFKLVEFDFWQRHGWTPPSG
jgi:hypothetical protein